MTQAWKLAKRGVLPEQDEDMAGKQRLPVAFDQPHSFPRFWSQSYRKFVMVDSFDGICETAKPGQLMLVGE